MTMPARSAVVIIVGMTVRQARGAVAAVWPYVVLRLFHGTAAYYKEGLPYADDAYTEDDDILRNRSLSREPTSDHVLLLGAMTGKERRDRLYTLFGLEAHWEYSFEHLNMDSVFAWGRDHYVRHDTLDGMQMQAERWHDAFKEHHGRPPTPADRFDGVTPKPG